MIVQTANNMTKQTILQGYVTSLLREVNEENQDYYFLQVRTKDGLVRIYEDDFAKQRSIGAMTNNVGKPIFFLLKEADLQPIDANYLLGSHKEVREKEREKLLVGKEAVVATVTRLIKDGAIVSYNGITGTLMNEDFSSDRSVINQVYGVGDKVRVKVKENVDASKISFEMAEKYAMGDNEGINAHSVGDVLTGKITNVTDFGIFINIGKGLDVLASLPEEEVEIGNEAVVRLTVIDKETNRLRGKIVRLQIVEDQEQEIPKYLMELLDSTIIEAENLVNNEVNVEDETEAKVSEEDEDDLAGLLQE